MGNSASSIFSGNPCKCVENQKKTRTDPAFESALSRIEDVYELSPSDVSVIESVHTGGSLDAYRDMQESLLARAESTQFPV